jgi:hypothetical protein
MQESSRPARGDCFEASSCAGTSAGALVLAPGRSLQSIKPKRIETSCFNARSNLLN